MPGDPGGRFEELSRLLHRLSRLEGVIERERGRLIERCIERTVSPELKDRRTPVLRWLLTQLLAFEGLFTARRRSGRVSFQPLKFGRGSRI